MRKRALSRTSTEQQPKKQYFGSLGEGKEEMFPPPPSSTYGEAKYLEPSFPAPPPSTYGESKRLSPSIPPPPPSTYGESKRTSFPAPLRSPIPAPIPAAIAPIIPLDIFPSAAPHFVPSEFAGEQLSSRFITRAGLPKYDFPCTALVHSADMKIARERINSLVVPLRIWSEEEHRYVTKPARLVVDIQALETPDDGRIYHFTSRMSRGFYRSPDICEEE